jgi:pimeloyl-ACP methyl ester carboxylesterase
MRLTTHRLPGLVLTDHEFSVPLDPMQPEGETLIVFAREVVAAGREKDHLPWLVFFQGGPGSEAPRPEAKGGWLKRAVQDYRVLLLDQRGTGRSTPVNHQTVARFTSAEALADYLKYFRADSIVWDAEWIRHELTGGERWSALGQSYGGFCNTTYLSLAPAGLREVMFTGGLPPLQRSVDEIYRATYRRVLDRNRQYYERYPADVERAAVLVDFLTQNEVRLPTGDRLTPRRFQQLGIAFGMSNGFEPLHYLLESAFVEGAQGRELNYSFLRGVENAQHYEINPIYAILHEACYCEGAASRWSAERVRAEYPEFALAPDQPVYFTGEMIYPWMFDDYTHLRPLKEAAEILANTTDWPALYLPDVLRANTVPCAAVVYDNDMYVERAFSEEAAQTIQGLRLWVTNEYEHNGLRADGEKILGRLLDMLHGEV